MDMYLFEEFLHESVRPPFVEVPTFGRMGDVGAMQHQGDRAVPIHAKEGSHVLR